MPAEARGSPWRRWAGGVPTLAELGFAASDLRALGIVPGMSGGRQRLSRLSGAHGAGTGEQRDFPAVKGVSYLSVHLRFGTLSVRELVAQAIAAGALHAPTGGAATWLSELVWRDFYFMILDRFPYVSERSFKPQYDAIVWEQGPHCGRGLRRLVRWPHRLSRWSMPPCGNSTAPATCITACACSWLPF
jgi:deoxyribodipyrimidine photo-lyase